MRKPLAVLIGFIVLALGLSACDVSVEPVAARVGSESISVSDLNAALQSAKNDAGYRCYIESQSQAASAVQGVGSNTYSSAFVAGQLGILTSAIALHYTIAEKHITTGSTIAHTIATDQLTGLFTPQSGGSCTENAKQTIAGLSPTYRTSLLNFISDEVSLAANFLGITLTDAGVHAYETANPKTTTQDCISAVLVTSEAKANSVYSQLQKGAKFAAVAKANSTDATSAAKGGAIGCLNPDELSAPLGPDVEKMAVGKVSAPIKFSSGYVVLLVTSRKFPAPSAAIFDAIENELSSSVYGKAVSKMVAAEHVQVSPQYGKVSVAAGTVQITPAPGPGESFLSNTTAISPA